MTNPDEQARAKDIANVMRGTIANLRQGYAFTQSVLDTLELTAQFLEQEIAAALREERRRVWKEAAEDLSHGLPEVWKKALIARCRFKAEEETP